MITTLFNKSKPINYTLIIIFMVVVFVVKNINLQINVENITKAVLNLGLVLLSFPVLHYLVKNNNLTQRHSYAILIYALLIAMFPEVLIQTNLLIANLLVLNAIRIVISLKDGKSIKKKTLNASLLVGIATLFWSWTVLFIIVIFIALLYFFKGDIKNLFIPFIGLGLVFLLLVCYNILVFDVYIMPSNFNFSTSFNYTNYNSKANILRLTILVSDVVWTTLHFFQIMASKNRVQKPIMVIVLWALAIGFVIALISPIKNGAEVLFLLAPFSIIMANYIENIKERWLKETFIVVFLITPIIGALL